MKKRVAAAVSVVAVLGILLGWRLMPFHDPGEDIPVNQAQEEVQTSSGRPDDSEPGAAEQQAAKKDESESSGDASARKPQSAASSSPDAGNGGNGQGGTENPDVQTPAPGLKQTELTLTVDASSRLEVQNASQTPRFYSANELVAKVDERGTVTGVGLGKTTIFVYAGQSEPMECSVSVRLTPQPGDEQEGITRGEWIALLIQQLGLPVSDPQDEESSYTDIADSPYFRQIEYACRNGWLEDTGVAGAADGEFCPQAPATREFASVTTARAMGFVLEYKDGLRCSDSSQLKHPKEDQLIIEQCFLNLEDGSFLPGRNLRKGEQRQILEVVKNWNILDNGTPHETLRYAPGVVADPLKNITQYTLEQLADGTYRLVVPRNEATAAVEAGQTVILPENDVWESGVVLTVNKRTLREETVEFEGVVPENPLELVEFFSFLGAVEPDWDKAQWEDGVDVTVGPAVSPMSADDRGLSTEFELTFAYEKDGLSFQASDNMELEVAVDMAGYRVDQVSVNMKSSVFLGMELSTEFLNPECTKMELGSFPARLGTSPFEVECTLWLVLEAEGEVKVGVTLDEVTCGFSYQNGELRKLYKESPFQITLEAEATLKEGLKPTVALNFDLFKEIGITPDVGAFLGMEAEIEAKVFPSPEVFLDLDINENPLIELSVSQKVPLSLLDKVLEKFNIEAEWTVTLLDFPEVNLHFENGEQVPECTLDQDGGDDGGEEGGDQGGGEEGGGEEGGGEEGGEEGGGEEGGGEEGGDDPLNGPGILAGAVYCPDGVTPLEGATVFIGYDGHVKEVAVTDASGRYYAENVVSGVVAVSVYAEGYCDYYATEIIEQSGVTQLPDIVMMAPTADHQGGVIIRFIDPYTKKPIASNAAFELRYAEGSGEVLREGTGVGSVQMQLPEGSYMIDVYPDADEYTASRTYFDVYADMLVVRDVILAPHYTDGRENILHLALTWTSQEDYDLEPSGLYWPGYPTESFKIGHDETEGYIGGNRVAWMEHSADGTVGEHAYVKMDNAGTVVVRGIYYTENWNAFDRIKDATIWVYYNDVPVWKQYADEELPTWHALFVSGETGMCTKYMGGTVTSPTLEDLVNAGITAQASKLPAPEQMRSAGLESAA